MIGSYLIPNISLQEELDVMSVIDGLDSVSFDQAELQQSLAMCSLAWHILKIHRVVASSIGMNRGFN